MVKAIDRQSHDFHHIFPILFFPDLIIGGKSATFEMDVRLEK
jgi:hypothetical protein